MEAHSMSIASAASANACPPFDLEGGDQRATHIRNSKSCSIVSAFVLGMMLATMGFLTAKHYTLGDASFTKKTFAPAMPKMQRVSGVTGTSVAKQVSNNKGHHLDSASLISIHHPVLPSQSQQVPISLPDMEDLKPPTMSIHDKGTMKQAFRPAAEPQDSPRSFSTYSLQALPLLMIISGLTFLWQRGQRSTMGSMGGGSTSMVMMSPGPLTFSLNAMAADDETMEASLPASGCSGIEESLDTEVVTREDMQSTAAIHFPPPVGPRPDAAYSRTPAPVMFKGMSTWKLPSLSDAMKEREAAAKFGDKKIVVITGTSSGLGRKAALALLRTGSYHVIGAVRDMDKMEAVAEIDEFDKDNFTPMEVELNSFESVRKFCSSLQEFTLGRPLDRLVCNAGIYQPSLPYAKWSSDGHEQTMQVNYLSHFLMVSLLLPDLTKAGNARVILIGSVTGNDNTVGGGGVYPVADLKQLEGLKAGAKNPVSMFDGYNFDGAKAYKDSKLCLMMLSNMLHDRYAKQTGIAFSSIYPGCMAESPLFREKRPWFRKYFPIFMKYITGGFVSEEEAGMRLFQVAHDPRCSKSGIYWSWNGGPREGRGTEALERDGQIAGGGGAGGGWDSIYENDQSDKVLNRDTASELFKHSTLITGAEWPPANQAKSPCPTLKVIGAMTKMAHAKEEAKRIKPMEGNVHVGLGTKLKGSTVKVADAVIGNTVGRAAGAISSRVLGELPDAARKGSYQEEAGLAQPKKKRYGLLRRIRRFGRGPPKEDAEEITIEVAGTAVDIEDDVDEMLAAALELDDKLDPNDMRSHLEKCIGEECELETEGKSKDERALFEEIVRLRQENAKLQSLVAEPDGKPDLDQTRAHLENCIGDECEVLIEENARTLSPR